MINLDALLSAIQERKRLAEAATPGPWIEEYSSETGPCVIPADAQSTREFVARTQLYAAVFDAKHIAENDPAATLRQVERDLRVLRRHHRDDVEPYSCVACSWEAGDALHFEQWPCIEVRELAHAYAIPTEDGTP